ncbi:MAG: hypothetical protein M1822_000191 [Bathelium mastoideum]|nr:MAG: hypothetical protein M1822_000191 [Bathelium mastoideum]
MNDVGIDANDVRKALKKAEIIPTVIDDFHPTITIHASWTNATAHLGNAIPPEDLQSAPRITLLNNTHPALTAPNALTNLVLTLTDPDAPSRDDPKWAEICHWIATDLSLSDDQLTGDDDDGDGDGDDLVPYKPPGPPPKTGAHRYVFLAFAPANGTAASLNLTRPRERQHWGTGKQEHGVRDWADENGLVPVGANFIHSQNEEQ